MDYEIVGSYNFRKSDSRISIGIVVSGTLLDRVNPIPHPQAAGVKIPCFSRQRIVPCHSIPR
jgi:hypothetical protein